MQKFERQEAKYILDNNTYKKLLQKLNNYIEPDAYPTSEIKSLYFDTDNYRIARTCMEKPAYKQKLRLRSYGNPENIFFEQKIKFNKI